MTGYLRAVSKASVSLRQIGRQCREVGITGTFKLCAGKLISEASELFSLKKEAVHPFDLKYGTETSGIIKPRSLDIPDEMVLHAIRYQTAIVEVFLDILTSLSISYEDYLFVDLGSGKGRALLLASQFPFKGVIGVELSANLHRIACQNIQVYRDELQQCHKVQSVCEDAGNYEIPDENIVFYLYNPFDEHVMRVVLSNIQGSIRRYPRDIYLAYLKPVYRDVFERAGFLQIVKETERYVIYKNKPLAAS